MAKHTGDQGGRPIIELTPEQVDQVEGLAAFLTKEQIAAYFGITRPTWNEIIMRQPEVFLRYEKGKAKAVGKVGQNLIMQAAAGNVTAAIFYLKTQGGWKETQAVEHVGAQQPVFIINGVKPKGVDD